ncbi:uncharacterized protein LOC108877618 isoform X2 [Lates calcarifer]|uniref:Uncharacterized protein LOC108877618 isoform X2 n=1 Tax=Lates calcarifer TaxID=8187 RepID=A0AAJ7LGZ9_LATCA|nr:uncharacterized protein LOC108877618 isoform X2 [Lates calcarifer]
MHLKQNGYCFGVLLTYTITIITLPSVSWCEPFYSSQPNSHLAPRHVTDSVLTTKGLAYPFSREDSKQQHLDSKQGQLESRNLPVFDHLENGDGTQAKTFGGRPEQRLRPRMASSSNDESLKNRHKLKQTEGEWMYSSRKSSNEDCSKGKMKHVIHGKFYIVGQLEPNTPKVDYQSDSAVSVQAEGGQARIRGQQVSGSEESWQRLQPVVECGDDAMTLIVRRRRATQLLLDRVNESSVPLSQLPPQCGYSVRTTWRDLNLMAQYDACHVTQEVDSYVLPLLWRGTPVKMSCPVSQIQPHATGPSSLCCSPYGMTITVQGLSATEELRINVRGEWAPLVVLTEQCGYTMERQDAEIVITAAYLMCGITVKDGRYTLSLQIGEKTFTLSCPISPPEELPLTHQLLVNSPLSRGLTEHIAETIEPFPWAPPYYLAPPNYPHPTYHRKYPRPDVHDAHNPPTPPSTTPDPTFGPQPLQPVDSQPDHLEYYSHQIPVRESYKQFRVHSSLPATDEMDDSSQVYPDVQEEEETPVLSFSEKHSTTPSAATRFPVQVEAPSLHPPSHAFNPYYHYYHHPKIPLPGLPQDPDPGPEVAEEPSSPSSHNSEFLMFPPSVQQSEVNSDQFPQPVPEAASDPYILPRSPKFVHEAPAPHPQPYPYHYLYYIPHFARGEAKRLAPPHGDVAANTNLSSVYPLSRSSALPVHDKYIVNPHIDQPNADERISTEKYSPDWIKNPLLYENSDDDVKPDLDDTKRHSTSVIPAVQPLPHSFHPEPKPVAAPSPEQPSFPTPSKHNPPPYPYYYHYYQMYYGPESLQSADNHVTPTSFKTSSFPVQHPSYRKYQPTPSPTESTYDVQNGRLHPSYYYYHLFYQPEVSKDNQELHPAGSMDSEKASSKSESEPPSESDLSMKDLLVHAAEAGYLSIPQPEHSPLHSFYSHYMTRQHPYDPSRHPGGEEAEERWDNEMREADL